MKGREVVKRKILAAFKDREDKGMIFDKLMADALTTQYREEWIADALIYIYSRNDMANGNCLYCLEVMKPAGVIFRKYFAEDLIDFKR